MQKGLRVSLTTGQLERIDVLEPGDVIGGAAGGVYLSVQSWQALTLQNGWVWYGGSQASPRFYRDPFGTVHLSGLIKDGSTGTGTVIATLPSGYRPDAYEIFTVYSANASAARLDVQPNGDIVLFDSANYYVSLDGVAFRAAGTTATALLNAALAVQEQDGTPAIVNATKLIFPNGTVTNLGNGEVLIDVAAGGTGGSSLVVEEADGTPSVTASKIVVGNGDLQDLGSGVVRLKTAADASGSGGGGGSNPGGLLYLWEHFT